MSSPFPLEASVRCSNYHFDHVCVKVTGNLVHVSWDEEITKTVNTAMEDLWVQVYRIGEDQPFFEKKCTHLHSTEFYLDESGEFQLRLTLKEHFKLYMATDFHYTPKVSLVSENDRRHHLTWCDIDWERVRNEVERAFRINWDEEVDLFVHCIRKPFDTEGLPREEWIWVGTGDYAVIMGRLNKINLAVVKKEVRDEKGVLHANLENPTVLKIIFTLDFQDPDVVGELFCGNICVPADTTFFELKREVWEEDTVQLRAWWKVTNEDWALMEQELLRPRGLEWEDVDLEIELHTYSATGTKKVEGQGGVLLPGATDWLFHSVEDGAAYQAKIFLRSKTEEINQEILSSTFCAVPKKPDHIVLLPIDERRGFTYWHIDKGRLEERLSSFAKETGSQVKTFIKVYHEWGGSLHHQMHLDVEVHLGLTDNWYMNLEPDKVYRVQLVAVSGDEVMAITDVSNSIQTARVFPGNNPVEFREVDFPGSHPTARKLESVMGTSENSIGLLLIHLHAHLPYIRKRVSYGESGFWQPMGYPPEWFHEAVKDTYIPLITIFEKLVAEGVDFRLSMDISPTLSNMMRCPFLQEEFLKYIDAHINLARAEVDRTRRQAMQYHDTAWMHLNRFLEIRDCFLKYDGDLTKAFKKFQDMGYLEISTCGATHAFLPFFTPYPESVRGQIETAVKDYEDTFGTAPRGIWLPECAYVPGLERFVQDAGLRYFFTETHAVTLADCPVVFGTHAPVYLKGSDVAAFARDPETGKQVWSGEEGYPGDPDYLDFHFKGGPLRYNRITTRTNDYKEPYVRQWALEKAARHAQHFMEARNFRFRYIKDWFWKKPLVVAMYDAELFGHHWFEGTDFLYFLLKKLYYNQNETELITPSAYLQRYPRNQEVFLNPSSWGDKGTFDKWMYGSVSWMYRHSHEAIRELVAMASHWKKEAVGDEIARRIVAQAGREVLQSMNSDIPFVISNGHFVDRMKEYFFEDLERFWILASIYWDHDRNSPSNICRLENLERTNPIFPVLDPEVFIPR
ncbi:MAG: DUF1957 domain-containing protein [Thermodesulfobacteria bacterium]|nr:DUF1957 domain-containing protein [Thermodesulfobacteriota bacterium]